jgi:hypothetical protein
MVFDILLISGEGIPLGHTQEELSWMATLACLYKELVSQTNTPRISLTAMVAWCGAEKLISNFLAAS